MRADRRSSRAHPICSVTMTRDTAAASLGCKVQIVSILAFHDLYYVLFCIESVPISYPKSRGLVDIVLYILYV